MLSNDVAALGVDESCQALLLTPKARVIAPLVVWRRGEEDFLLLTEPELGETLRVHLTRMRLAAKAEVAPEEHESYVALGRAEGGIANHEFGVPAVEVVGAPPSELPEVSPDELELLRIKAKTARYGREIDDRVLPAEAGLVERTVSFTKGCYPGQEPIARLHHRGHANRGLRVLELAAEVPDYDAEVTLENRVVGRVTSAAPDGDGRVLALAYVRAEVPEDAPLAVGDAAATQLH
jgi:folate-binding protein YgfZ